MESIFYLCEQLENLYLSKLDTNNVRTTKQMALDCEILKEIIYLENFFNYHDVAANKIVKELLLFKNQEDIIIALKSIINMITIFKVEDKNNLDALDKLLKDVENIKYLNQINDVIKILDSIDIENILEKNFFELLKFLYKKDDLLEFLILQKESEARNLIDGLFDSENEDAFIELYDIEVFIKLVCFITELKNKTKNIKEFLSNFHQLLNNKEEMFKNIAPNFEHIYRKLDRLKEFIKLQLGKNYKYSANIENFINKGIVKFITNKYLSSNYLPEKENKEEYKYEVFIQIEEKEMSFNYFNEIINKIKLKNIYKYGKYKEYFSKSKKIVELIEQILYELNFSKNIEFNKNYDISKLDFIDKGSLKITQLENDLTELKKKNYQIKEKIRENFGNSNPNIYDLDEKKFNKKIYLLNNLILV